MECLHCGVILTLKPWEIRQKTKTITRKFCSRKCSARYGGIDPIKTRYHILKIEGRKISEHRWVMENHLGRKLEVGEYVHHIDHDKTNNDISNLKIVTPKEHGIEHTTHPIHKICVMCGNGFEPHKTKRKIKQTCSKKCRYDLISKTQRLNFLSKQKKRLKS